MDDAFAPVLYLQPEGQQAPLFCIHGGVGLAWPYLALAPHLPADQPIIGLQADRIMDGSPQPESIGDLAEGHLAKIRAIQPQGPYRLLGWSFGGYVAHEIAVRLQAAGDHVDFLGVLDIYPYVGYDDDVDDVTLFERLVQISGEDIENHELAAYIAELDYDGIAALPHRPRSLLSEFTSAGLRRIMATMHLHQALGASFTPGIFTGDLHLVIATLESPGSEGNPSSLWSEYISGQILATRVDILHDDLLDAGSVAKYASQLVATLS
jgi:thioesterase domain-containing protein